jgi:regulator of replication initiation timing
MWQIEPVDIKDIAKEAADEIERLRAENEHLRKTNSGRPSAELYEAHMAELRAENEAIKADLSNLQVAFNDWKVMHSTVRLEVEAARLRVENEALRKLADSEGSRAVEYLRRARKAEAALAAQPSEPDWHRQLTEGWYSNDEALKSDAEKWRAYKARKDAVIAAGMGRSPMRAAQPSEPKTYTEGHCPNRKHPGSCQLHNLQCGYPDCDRRPVKAAQPEPVTQTNEALKLLREIRHHAERHSLPREWLTDADRVLGTWAPYAAPPVRTLTDEEIDRLIEEAECLEDRRNVRDLVRRAIEAAIRSKE